VRTLELMRAYVAGDPGLDFRSRALGNLALALGFSAGLHAALLSSLEWLPVRSGGVLSFSLTVGFRQLAEPAPVPAGGAAPAPSAAPSDAAPGTVVPPRYLSSREVDTPAVPRQYAPLLYPEEALAARIAGVVRVRVFISERGTVDSAHVVSANPPGSFDGAALEAIRKMAYAPAMKRGLPVKSQKLVEVTFDPDEKQHSSALPAQP